MTSEATYHDRHRLDLATWPEFAEPFRALQRMIIQESEEIAGPLKAEVFTVASLAAGCRHCQAHGAYQLHTLGEDTERIEALWDFERSPIFNDAERAALRLARDAAFVPNDVTAQHFEDLREHYSDRQIVELLVVVSLGGFLNRYNDSVATVTDQESLEWAMNNLTTTGWQPGKHRGDPEEQRQGRP